jgi:hypothetical protein
MMTTVLTDLPLLEGLLDAHAEAIGLDLPAYRNHCFRVVNLCLAVHGDDPPSRDKAQVAAAFHDLGIWTHRTFDYLAPSAELARQYLRQSGREAWQDEVVAMITEHHKLRPAAGDLVDAFRRADWMDVSLGLLQARLPPGFMAALKREFPNRGFHRRLLQLGLQRLRSHPLSPLPMMKW